MSYKRGKCVDVTTLAFEHNTEYQSKGYVKVLVMPEMSAVWIIRVLKDLGDDYAVSKGSYIVESHPIQNFGLNQKLTDARLEIILETDRFDKLDFYVFDNYETAMSAIETSFGFSD